MNFKKWKKYTVGLALMMSGLLLAACGGDDSKDAGEDGEVDNSSIEVSVESGYVDFIKEIAPKFEEETGISVDITEKDMFETLETLSLDGPAGIAADVTIAPYDRIGGLGQQGHLAPVEFQDDGRYDEIDEQQVTVDGETYGSPYVIEALILYYNKDLLDEAPETFEELEELSQDEQFAYASEEGKNTAFLSHWIDFYHSYGLLSGFGGYVFGNNGVDTSDVGLNTPEAIEAIEYAKTWYDQWPEGMLDLTGAADFMDDTFINGSAAAIMNGPWSAGAYNETDLNYGVAPMPDLPNGNPYEPFGGGKGWIISEYTENLEGSQLWLDFVTNEENMTALYEYNNEVPANQQSRETIVEADEDDLAIAVVEQYDNAVPMPNIPEMAEVWEGAESMMFDAVSGNKTAKESADDSVEIIEDNIEQKY